MTMRSAMIALACVLGACATLQQGTRTPPLPQAVKAVRADVQVAGSRDPRFVRVAFADEFLVSFAALPGRLSGKPATEPLLLKAAKQGAALELDLSSVEAAAEAAAAPLAVRGRNSTLAIKPKQTRFARITTEASDLAGANKLGLSGFLDPASKDYLVLAYFDRPSTLRGRSKAAGAYFHHAVDIPNKGFHWLRYRRTDARRFVVTAVKPKPEPKFCLLLFPQGKVEPLRRAALDSPWGAVAIRLAALAP